MRPRTLSFGIALVLAAFLFAGSVPAGAEEIEETEEIFPGITHTHIVIDDPPLNINILEVDLDEEDIRFFVTPGNGDDPLDYTAQTTSDFNSTGRCRHR